MKLAPITCGQIRELLRELNYSRKQLDDRYDAFYEKRTGMFYALPRWSDDTPASESHVVELKLQLDYRGLMDQAEFDARFATPAAAKS